MVEVFKTNVGDRDSATLLIAAIHNSFEVYTATFDLEDCDKILRIECNSGDVQTSCVIGLLKDFGFTVEILADNEYYDPFAKSKITTEDTE